MDIYEKVVELNISMVGELPAILRESTIALLKPNIPTLLKVVRETLTKAEAEFIIDNWEVIKHGRVLDLKVNRETDRQIASGKLTLDPISAEVLERFDLACREALQEEK